MRKWIGGLLGSAVLLLALFSTTPAMAENIDQLAVTGQSQLAELDVESLNEAIANLQKTLAPLAKLFG